MLKPLCAPGVEHPSICPHCWNVNPGPFRLCARCGASMESFLQESGGLRRTAPVQSPVPVARRLSPIQRAVIGAFLALLVLSSLAPLFLSRGAPPRPLLVTAP
jgi:predicted amidophosphoribosyltransferase